MYNFNKPPPGYLVKDKYKYRYPNEEILLKPGLFTKKLKPQKYFATSKMFQSPNPSNLPHPSSGGGKKEVKEKNT